jgi:hypothetical protein
MLVWTEATTGAFPCIQQVTLTTSWKRYRIPVVWQGTEMGNIRFAPGGEDVMPCSAIIFGVQIDDYGGDYLPSTGSMVTSTAGNRWERAIVPAGGVRIATTSLGGGSTATLSTIGGSGPATAAQNSWVKMYDLSGTPYWVPAWR